MKKIVLAVAVTMFAGVAMADTAGGTLTVSGTIQSSINLTITSAGATGGTGTAAVTSALSDVSKYGAAPSGFTLNRSGSNWTLQTSVGVTVNKANLDSPDFTLTAQLVNPAATGVSYTLKDLAVTDGGATSLETGAAYGSPLSYAWKIIVADTAADETDIDNVISFTATSN